MGSSWTSDWTCVPGLAGRFLTTGLAGKPWTFSSVLFSRLVLFNSVNPWTAARQASLSFTISRSLLKFMSIELVMPSNCLILCCPILLPSIFPRIRVFSNESAFCIRWPSTGVSASTLVLPMNIQDWFPLGWTGWIFLQTKGLSNLFQHHSSNLFLMEEYFWLFGKNYICNFSFPIF